MAKKSRVGEEPSRGPGFWRKNWADVLGAGLSGAVILWVFYVTRSSTTPTPAETTYQSIILAAASVFASWFTSKIHAQYSQDESLRSLGSQVAQGIIVLSAQIDTLLQWVANARDSRHARPDDGELDHIEQTLKSLKPLSVLALGGVGDFIGGPLRRYERVQSQIGELVDDQMRQTDVLTERIDRAANAEEVETLRQELKRAEQNYERKLAELTSELPIPIPTEAHLHRIPCPYCDVTTSVMIRSLPGSTTRSLCSACNHSFNAHVSAAGVAFSRPLSAGRPRALGEPVPPDMALLRNALVGAQSFLRPEEVEKLVAITVRLDEEARRSDTVLTPRDLKARLVEEASRESYAMGAQAKRFFSLIYYARFFKFNPGVQPSLTAQYINEVHRTALLEKYVRSCLWRIWEQFSFSPVHAPLVAEVLFDSVEPEGVGLAARAIDGLLKLRSPVAGAASGAQQAPVTIAPQAPGAPTNASVLRSSEQEH